jgi:hypothetical protein
MISTQITQKYGSDTAKRQRRQTLQSSDFDFQRKSLETQEFMGGAGFRQSQQALAQANTNIGLAAIGNVGQAGQRAYTFGREEDELGRLRMASEGQRLQSQMAFQPQMDAIRGGIMSRMGGNLGVSLPQMGQSYQSGTGYTPSWMQSINTPQFPRY